jgi:membrane-bound serine protease (ClpP class)
MPLGARRAGDDRRPGPIAGCDDGTVSQLRRASALVVFAAGLAGAAWPAAAQEPGAPIIQLRLDGVVDPFVANYLEGGIAAAGDRGASAVLLTIDTPGGLDSSMRQITQAILNAEVPVICYVSPEGARAASAGAFVLLSCHVAAMAPATNVGAAHPVGVAGAIESEKATNDAAEYIVGIAERRGRDAEWAERAVRDSESASATEALELGVIDLIEPNVPALFDAIAGREVELADGRRVTLDLAGAPIEDRQLGLVARLLHALLDPNVAFILFYLGVIALYFEFAHPGLSVPGVLGVIMLVGAFLSFGVLPVQLAGLLLLLASAIFFVIELFTPGVGVALGGGITTLILGGLFLFDTSVPDVRVSPLVIAPVAVGAGLFFGIVVRAVTRARRSPAAAPTDLVGKEALVVRDLDPEGVVHLAAEEWSAVSATGATIPHGSHVRVAAVDGLVLRVGPAEAPSERDDAPSGPDEGTDHHVSREIKEGEGDRT